MSSNVRHDAKRDANEGLIVEFLRKHGCTVDRISGTGVPDLLVGYRGINILMEVKMPGKKLRPAQEQWHSRWLGQKAVVETADDAERVLGAFKDLIYKSAL
jgi:hypothetical protein